MKSRFTTFDIKAIVHELQQRLAGLRVVNVYDIDTKTYLIKLAKTDEKAVLLLESGIRLHTTEFEWPKNVMPSGFAMKMRKHLKGRRLEKIEQLGVDRIVDMQFGSNEAAYHVILELYDRGNIILTDHEYTILNIQRPRTDDSQDVRFAVRERYPVELAKQHEGPITLECLMSVLMAAQEGDNLKKILNPQLVYGGSLIEHSLLLVDLNINARLGHDFKIAQDASRLLEALHRAEAILTNITVEVPQGYIIQQKEKKAVVAAVGENEVLMTYSEFHPFLFKQHEHQPNVPFSSFDRAVDEFFSKIESQKQDRKLIQQEKTALKKLDGIKNEHVKRLDALKTEQEVDTRKAKFIEMNLTMVDRAITVIRSALANQIDWPEIEQMIEEATQQGDSVASSIKSLKLDTNHFTMLLKVPTDSDDELEDCDSHEALKPLKVDIDLGLSAYANARKYYDMKRHAAVKEQKTVDATEKAMKSAERKTKLTLKEVRMVATINKARKTFWLGTDTEGGTAWLYNVLYCIRTPSGRVNLWFEKFLWFISSENYIVIGGRDQQQNEIIVKRYLKPGDLYVHADLHGASSVVIKNPSREPVPPKTLNEAGTMALCYSAAWDAKVVTSSWWVYHDQVSKTAPSGEYLTTGSFMIRGKKNYLPPSHLIYGFGFLFKVDESSIFRHKNERRVRTIEEEEVSSSVADSTNDLELKDAANDELCSVDEEEEEKTEGSEESSDSETEEQKGADEKKEDLAEDESEEEPDAGDEGDAGEKEIPGVINRVENVICDFPDTSIQLHHVKGGEFTLKKELSVSDSTSEIQGSSVPENQSGSEQDAGPRVARLSARQRRELKKKKKVGEQTEVVKEEKTEELEEVQTQPAGNERLEPPQTQPQAKRGQKAKLKKIKEKYGDQDEEERQLRMELLASSRGPKEEKLKKGKKGKQQLQQLKNKQQGTADGKKQGQLKGKGRPFEKLTIHDITDDKSIITANPESGETEELGEGRESVPAKTDDAEADEDGQDGLEEDGGQIMQDADLLNSLTGIPDAEDILLFSVPVCAPYGSMVNYKYKVKLVPGTTRRGKAAKTALNMFLYDKTAVTREKDLLKILKDTDVSRNMPGKVKVSAPNLHKQKHK